MDIHQTMPSPLAVDLAQINFCDNALFPLRTHGSITAEDLLLAFFTADPPFLRTLMRLRDALVRPFGLRVAVADQPNLAPPFRVGQKIGLFQVLSIADAQIVIGQDDRHLDIRILLSLAGPERFRLTTQVQINNLLGRLYLALVMPFHRRLVPVMGRRVSQWLEQNR